MLQIVYDGPGGDRAAPFMDVCPCSRRHGKTVHRKHAITRKLHA
eukprot:CAMPEP_0113678214 /NCGR_PEP_ID=MMETSP0038_2-20120614/9791_1 /TAXON_ID=2898 /ORGANISM="Cryptomonas paramecium" /LENGTH=43 /DNA_ID=CAMNT_0000595763 /DNA_START=839 /DNA_END=966 /DNA_ORIENTATION=- /assembly_acc=CAM_ASM_000170